MAVTETAIIVISHNELRWDATSWVKWMWQLLASSQTASAGGGS